MITDERILINFKYNIYSIFDIKKYCDYFKTKMESVFECISKIIDHFFKI